MLTVICSAANIYPCPLCTLHRARAGAQGEFDIALPAHLYAQMSMNTLGLGLWGQVGGGYFCLEWEHAFQRRGDKQSRKG